MHTLSLPGRPTSFPSSNSPPSAPSTHDGAPAGVIAAMIHARTRAPQCIQIAGLKVRTCARTAVISAVRFWASRMCQRPKHGPIGIVLPLTAWPDRFVLGGWHLGTGGEDGASEAC